MGFWAGCVNSLQRGVDRLRSWVQPGNEEEKPDAPILSMPSQARPDSVEIFALPGHGRTSYLWATVFMLRQLSRVWPKYLCWPLDEATAKSLLEVHENLRSGRLPDAWRPPEVGEGEREEALKNGQREAKQEESSEGEPTEGEESLEVAEEPGVEEETIDGRYPRYALHLRNMNPWGERRFVVSDRPDVVFNTERFNGSEAGKRPVRWSVPALWLLSLSDLDETQGRYLDLMLDDLIRVRHASSETAREYPFRLVVVLTKGDAIPDLPQDLRRLLKEDPLGKALAAQNGRLFRPHDEIDLSHPPSGYESYPEGDPLNAYFESRKVIHQLIRGWMLTNSSGRSLIRRAEELEVDLKFSLVSATGSGLTAGKQLATAWSPRRVLDPYFWCLELGG